MLIVSCNSGSDPDPNPDADRTSTCGTYPVQESSPYILPYEVGVSSEIMQANCTNNSHRRGTLGQFAYDFLLPIGQNLVAVRAGRVVSLNESFPNNTGVSGEENWVFITHDDGTQSRYFHLDQDGVLVTVGQRVAQGQVIARSGNSGGTPRPHLHLEVIRLGGAASPLPLTFKNTTPHPKGLLLRRTYRAEPF